MRFRRRYAAFLSLLVMTGCAAVSDWDHYGEQAPASMEPAPETTDTGSDKPDAKKAKARDADVAPKAIRVEQTGSAGGPNVAQLTASLPRAVLPGSTIIFSVAWFDVTTELLSMTDSFGSEFEVAVPATKFSSTKERITQQILFVRNARGGNYDLTIRFPNVVDTPDLRVAEVTGLDEDPLVAGLTNQARSKTVSVGPLTGPGLVFAAATVEDEFAACADHFDPCIISGASNMAELRILAPGERITVTHTFSDLTDFVMQAAVFH